MSMLLDGIGVSRGISIGAVKILHRETIDIIRVSISEKDINAEIKRFEKAIQNAARHLDGIRENIKKKFPADVVAFLDSHLLMINDDFTKKNVVDIIKKEKCGAEWALKIEETRLISMFDEMQDEYLKTRRDDVQHVLRLIQRFLFDKEPSSDVNNDNVGGGIIVTDDLTPADTVLLQHQNIAGFVTELGGPTSHTAILARSLNIPAIVAAHGIRDMVTENEEIIIDGSSGMIIASADNKIIKFYRAKQRENKQRQRELLLLSDRKTVTQDGIPITLMANIELAEEVKSLKKINSAGIGLYRTEFLYMNRTAATEEEQYRIYRQVLKTMKDKPVTFRTLDLGAEKEFDPEYKAPMTLNPALGLRAIRRSLKDPDLFLQQVRAILRASVHGESRLMLPMLTSVHEVEQAKQLIETAKEQLHEHKKAFDDNIQIGGMIEVPAAALSASIFAQCLDFISIGTNDLIQYTLAIDRIDDEVNYLYDPLHPSVLKLIAIVIKAGNQARIPVAMCGEMAGDPAYTKLLLGMGLKEFSAHLSTLLEVKEIVLNSDTNILRKKSQRILQASPDKIPAMVRAL